MAIDRRSALAGIGVAASMAWSSSVGAQAADPAAQTAASAQTAQPAQTASSAQTAQVAPAAHAVDEVRVHGNAADNLERASGSGSRVSETELRRAQPQSAGEMLRRVPGLVVRQEDPMGLRLNLGVRGLSPTRGRLVLVEEDGVPVVVSPYGEPELYYSTPVERIQNIDVIKGHEVLLYGPQTVGGVVQFHTWTPPTREEWNVEGTWGERGFAKALARYGNTAAGGDVRYVVQAFRKQGDGFRNMPFEVTDVMGKVVFATGPNGEATLKLVAYDELSHTTYVGLTEPMYQNDPRQDTVAPHDRFGIRRYEASLRHEQRFGDRTKLDTHVFAYTMNMGLRQQDFDRGNVSGTTYERILGPQGIPGAGLYFRTTSQIRDRNYNVVGVEPKLEHRLFTGPIAHKFIVGGRAMFDSARRRGFAASSPNADTGDLLTDDTTNILGFSAYAEDRIAFRDDVLVTPGFRVEHAISRRYSKRTYEEGAVRDVSLEGSSTATGLMPGIGMIVGKPHFNVFGGLHSGYSPPRISQSITPTGQDVGLSAERSTNWELGARVRPHPWARLEVSGFLTSFDNQLISNNTLSGSAAEFKNGGRTRHLGAELTALMQLGRGLRLPVDVDLAAQYTLSRSTFVGGRYDGNFVPYAPRHLVTATLDVDHARSGLGAQATFTHVGSQFADETNTVEADISGRAGEIPSYNVVDLGARYRHAKTGLSAILTVKNAFDDVYLSGRLPNGIFTSGFRQVFVTLKWSGP
ncbi:TonB-dependent receptor family protein [Pendulispora albinea]|uniref:TonB-dependent receptor n=1 Tax=Pendulispora albinea TaxID=2741071 RepID=A0ABZ2M5X2_9BACT